VDVASLWEKCKASVAETTRKRLQASEEEAVRGRAAQPERRARKKTPPKGQETQPDKAKVSDQTSQAPHQAAKAPQEHPTPDRPDENNERGSFEAVVSHVPAPLSPSTESKLIDELEESLKPESAVDKPVDPPAPGSHARAAEKKADQTQNEDVDSSSSSSSHFTVRVTKFKSVKEEKTSEEPGSTTATKDNKDKDKKAKKEKTKKAELKKDKKDKKQKKDKKEKKEKKEKKDKKEKKEKKEKKGKKGGKDKQEQEKDQDKKDKKAKKEKNDKNDPTGEVKNPKEQKRAKKEQPKEVDDPSASSQLEGPAVISARGGRGRGRGRGVPSPPAPEAETAPKRKGKGKGKTGRKDQGSGMGLAKIMAQRNSK